jgi:hypothetical protein
MRAAVIALFQIPADVFSRFGQAAILRSPHFFFLQAAVEPFEVAVALRVMVGRASVRDAELCQRLYGTAKR